MLHILYIGDSNPASTSAHRAHALERIGHRVSIKNPTDADPIALRSRWMAALHFRTGYRLVQRQMLKWTRNVVDNALQPDLIWIDSGELLGKECVQLLKQLNCPIVLYNIDDPTGKRDGMRFASLLGAIRIYDLVVVVREETQNECLALGAKKVLRVFRSYDEIAHRPFDDNADIPQKFRSEVAFIGTWMRKEKRDEFVLQLIGQGIDVNIWGDFWPKSQHFSKLSTHWRGPSLGGSDYIAAIQGAKICLGLLSHGNRDLHTTRSLEIPYAGGLLCAQRTSEHTELYREGVDAVFWSDARECINVCKSLLYDNDRIDRLKRAGMQRVRSLKAGNEDVCRTILEAVFEPSLIPNPLL